MTRYRRDRSWRAMDGGRTILAGSPLRLFRVSAGGAQVLRDAELGEHPPTDLVRRMLDRFVDAGALHPAPERGPYGAHDVTVVMPVLGSAPTPPEGLRTIVVDDGSPTPITLSSRSDARATDPPAPGASIVIRLEQNRGPAAARNTGLEHVTTPLVAFVDADVLVPDGWLDALLPHFSDERVALVAPRVRSADGAGLIAGYERRHSPLDLGDEPARVAAGTRVGYVPAAAIVCRTAALRDVGGFREDMRVGEDVDLVWRLVAAGHRCRYEPASTVFHRPRRDVAAMLRQRFGYGRSAAPLAQRHRGALSPVRMSGWSAAVWALVALRRPLAALVLAAGTAMALQRKLRDLPPAEVAQVVGSGHVAAGEQLARAVTRTWWPLALLAAIVLPRSRVTLAAALLAPPVLAAVRQRAVSPLLDAPMQWLDECSYCAGVWAGAITSRDAEALLPSFSAWPPRGDR